MFTLFTPESAQRFMQRFGEGAGPLNFRRYSKVLNPRLGRYDFDVSDLLR
jgi:hypothetical protein